MSKKEEKLALLEQLRDKFGGTVITRKQLVEFKETTGNEFLHWIANDKSIRVSRGVYDIGLLFSKFGGVTQQTTQHATTETSTEEIVEEQQTVQPTLSAGL